MEILIIKIMALFFLSIDVVFILLYMNEKLK